MDSSSQRISYDVKDRAMYDFVVEGLSLIEPDLACTFAGTSLGFRAVIICEQKQVMETARKEIKGNSIFWDEAFRL